MWFCCSICHINDTFVLDVEIWGIALFLDSGVNYAYSYVLGTISKLSLLLFVSHNTFSQSWSRGSWYSLTMEKEPRKTGKGWIRWSRSSDLAFFFFAIFFWVVGSCSMSHHHLVQQRSERKWKSLFALCGTYTA